MMIGLCFICLLFMVKGTSSGSTQYPFYLRPWHWLTSFHQAAFLYCGVLIDLLQFSCDMIMLVDSSFPLTYTYMCTLLPVLKPHDCAILSIVIIMFHVQIIRLNVNLLIFAHIDSPWGCQVCQALYVTCECGRCNHITGTCCYTNSGLVSYYPCLVAISVNSQCG